ncbi:MAG TPA: glycoside hydrolase family 2 TIM barrel-domain containing protein [Opitutus sp.]|nr:glycoside hydrolase family 2 TIM barrel-domain containing protein [Opitutus sp.]
MKRFLRLCLSVLGAMSVTMSLRASPAATERLYLSGRDITDAVAWEFRCSDGAKAGEWTTIPVPSNWEMHGFGTLSYSKTTPSEKGEYRHRFTLPAAWKDRRIRIVFDGVMTDTRVTVNGQSAGEMHQGGFYRFHHDITNLVRFDAENVLEVAVDETSANEGVNKAERTGDYWNFGGIYRPVWLEAMPAQAIDRVAIDARADGTFSVDAFLSGRGDAAEVEVRIVDAVGRPVAEPVRARIEGEKTRVQGRVPSPALWTAETPNLYAAEVSLRGAGGAAVHRTKARFGFRTFEVRPGDGFYLNGQRIVLQGANRHSFSATSGRALSEADHRADIRLMKDMNMNAVRMSHYPPDERFLELCDEEGLYVLDELAGWQKAYDTPVGRKLVQATVTRDVNHPSILFWDNGNEGGWNTELDADFAKWDPQNRPVLHPWQIFNGVNTAHYRLYPQLDALITGLEPAWRYKEDDVPKKHEHPLIYLPTEFLHGLFDGGAGAGMEDYWTKMRSGKYFGGGFIWAFMDEGVLRPDTGEIDVRGNLAPDGIIGPRREKEGSYYTLKELWSPIVVRERVLPETFDGTLTIENRYSFTQASACRFVWQLSRMPAPSAGGSHREDVLAAGTIAGPEVAPGATGSLKFEMPANWRSADVLSLRIEDPAGAELWTYTRPLAGLARFERLSGNSATGAGTAAARAVEDAGALTASAGEWTARFDKTSGALVEVGRGEKRLSFGAGLRPAVGTAALEGLESAQEGSDLVIRARYTGGLRAVEWRVRANGWIDCAYVYPGVKGSTFQGVCFDLPGAKIRGKRWVGEGPYRVWQNRLRGVKLGAWANAYNETITGWSGFEYPEFKGFFSGVRWLALETSGGTLTVVPRAENLYVQVMTPDLPPADMQMRTAIAMPEAGLGFLHVIPAIGTKFSQAEQMGPQGQTPEAHDEYRGAFSLRLE